MRTPDASDVVTQLPFIQVTIPPRSANDIATPERWLPVPGFEDAYEVSSHGRVRSLTRKVAGRTVRGQMLTPGRLPKGYRTISLSRNGVRWSTTVHVLVLTTFVGDRPTPKHEGCHGDGNPDNNHLWNLRWATSSENHLDTVRHGRHHLAKRTVCKFDHPLAAPNLVLGVMARGVRRCLACNRAAPTVWRMHRRGQNPDVRAIADAYYAEISGTVAVAA